MPPPPPPPATPPPSLPPTPAGPGASAALAALDPAERGFVLGMFAGGGAAAADLALALADPAAAARCTEAALALDALPRADRVRLLGLLAEETLPPPLPPGLDGIDPDVLARTLAAESDDTIELILRGAPAALRAAGSAVLAARATAAARQDDDARPPAVGQPNRDEGGDGGNDDDLIAELRRAVLSSLDPRQVHMRIKL